MPDPPGPSGRRAAEAEISWEPPHATEIHLTLAPLRRGTSDPTHRAGDDGALWRTTLTPDGPATMRLTQTSPHRITCQAWGPGAARAAADAADLLGARDDPTGFTPHPRLRDAHRRRPGLRIPRTGRVLEALLPAVIEQRVIGLQATAAWRHLVRAHGTPAPGPAPTGMLVVPDVEAWSAIPSWEWHRAGVDPRRVRTLRACLTAARRLEEATTLDLPAAYRRLTAIPGVGAWTAAEVAQRALGDADALSLGDHHLARSVGHALFDRDDFTDDELTAALDPYRPHRYRIVRLLEALDIRTAPRRAPKPRFTDHHRY